MPKPGARAAVALALYAEGVTAIADQAPAMDWDRPACGRWTAADVARHVAGVACWYHQWLDRALAGDAAPPFPASELACRNDDAIHARADQDPGEAVAEFVETASRYSARLSDHWEVPFGYPFGTVTVGLHAAAGASEWHLHAWDLAGVVGGDHRPSDPAALFRAVGRCVATGRGGLVGATQGVLVSIVAAVRPWEQLLRASGRRARR